MDIDKNISLVITTYNRFDTFLKDNLIKYLQNPYITEIVIYDDFSYDYDKVLLHFKEYINSGKISLYQQETNKGPLINKIIASNIAKYNWICLMDSDNFCDIDYFDALFKCWETKGQNDNIIYCPTFAKPTFNYESMNDNIIDKLNWNQMESEQGAFLNTGNYVFNKNLNKHICFFITNPIQNGIPEVKIVNRIFVINNVSLYGVPNMHYEHIVHDDSYWKQNQHTMIHFNGSYNWSI